MTVLERFVMHLNYKEFYSDVGYGQLLIEQGFKNPETTEYDHDTMKRKMLKTVLATLRQLSNDIDLYRKVEGQYGTVDAAKDGLANRIKLLEKEIDEMPLDPDEEPPEEQKAVVTSFWYSYKRGG